MDLDDEELYATRKAKGLLREDKCLHCGGNKLGYKAAYCEECYQELIGENVKLQEKIKICETTGAKLVNKEVILNNFINKEKVKESIEEIEDYFYRINVPDEDLEFIKKVKEELLEKRK